MDTEPTFQFITNPNLAKKFGSATLKSRALDAGTVALLSGGKFLVEASLYLEAHVGGVGGAGDDDLEGGEGGRGAAGGVHHPLAHQAQLLDQQSPVI